MPTVQIKTPIQCSSKRKEDDSNYPYLRSKYYKKCIEVYQQGYGITTTEKPFISTFGAGNCIAIVGYCKETRTAFMVHADTFKFLSNNIGTLYYYLNKVSEAFQMYDMYLFGGNYDESSEEFAKCIEYKFESFNHNWRNRIKIKFHSSYINQNITNICIDSKTGKFYSIDPKKCILPNNVGFMENWALKCQINALIGYTYMTKYE
jgi:hypothetical protein